MPEVATLDDAAWARCLGIVQAMLAQRPARLVRQFRLFVAVLRWLPALRYGAPLDRLEPARQDAVLRWFQDHPMPIVRKGFWGLKALIFMGYYGRAEAGPAIGYRPVFDGNAILAARR